VLTCRLYQGGRLLEEGFDPDRVPHLLREGDGVIWLDVVDPDQAVLEKLQQHFGFHGLAIEDVVHRNQRAKVEIYDEAGYSYLVVYGVTGSPMEPVEHEIHAFASTRYLVTVRYSPAFDLAEVLKRWGRQPEGTRHGAGFLLYVLLDEVVDGYLDMVDRFEDVSEDLEHHVFEEEPQPEVQEDIFRLKKALLSFRRRVMPLREVLDLLQEGLGLVTDPLRPFYRDVADHVIRALEFVDNLRELLTTALEAYLSRVSNRLNEVMKKLTAWASIILVPTLIAGVYGMNFRNIPEFDWLYGYPFALGLMLLAAGSLYAAFKRRDWL
jgi:magnesium transporter